MEGTRSLPEVRAWFVAHGLTVREWAKQFGFTPEQVYAVLSGRARGRHGAAHEIAIALGLKARPTDTDAWSPDRRQPQDSARQKFLAKGRAK